MLPTAQTRDKTDVDINEMLNIVNELKESFDYVIIDCPAGIEQGFENAVIGADRAIVIVNPEITSVRDADRVIGKLCAKGLENTQLVVNRINFEMTKNGDMLDIEDIKECLAIKLIGVVPDDRKVTISTNKGEPIVLDNSALAGQAFRNIARRITGEEVEFLNINDVNNNSGFFAAIKKIFGNKQ